jgi:aryl-alcohol dehydrogenase-like predicted oxidoreductase
LAAVTSVIIGPRTPDHLDDPIRVRDITLTQEELNWFDRLVQPDTYVSDHLNTAGWHRQTA